MSIKIYEAYKIPITKLNSFLEEARDQTFKFAGKYIDNLMSFIKPELIEVEWNRKYPTGVAKGCEKSSRKRIAFELVEKEIIKASLSTLKNPFDIECGFNIWLKGKFAYIIPIFPNHIGKNFKYPKYAKDYCYYNNTDRPKNITSKQWEDRYKNWESLCLDDWNKNRLYYAIIEVTNGSIIWDFEWYMTNKYFK